jgi:hypothetical protein
MDDGQWGDRVFEVRPTWAKKTPGIPVMTRACREPVVMYIPFFWISVYGRVAVVVSYHSRQPVPASRGELPFLIAFLATHIHPMG